MFRNFLKVTLRHIIKDKFYSFINIIGLTAGLTSCLLIGLFVSDELNYDHFHEKKDRIVRLTMEFHQGDDINQWCMIGTKPGPEFSRSLPFVQNYTRMFLGSRIVAYKDKIFEENKFLYADSSIFNIFTFPMIAGDPVTALNAPENIVITQSMARKYFGVEIPLGKTIRLDGENDFIITGIVKDIPSQSQIKFDFLLSFNNLDASQSEDWFPANYYTYFLLNENISIQEAEYRMNQFMKTIKQEEVDLGPNESLSFHLEPLLKIHLHSELGGMVPNGNITYIYILSIIALLILGIASINYANLAIAQSSRRQKEMGMRKVFGAHRRQLFYHFIMESMVLAGISGILAFLLSVQVLPFFNSLTGKILEVDSLLNPVSIGLLISLCAAVGFLSGIYPAILYSNLKLYRALKADGELKLSSGRLGKFLIVFQFVIAIFLILSTIVIHQQRIYIQQKNLGYNKENIIVLPIDRQVRPHYHSLKEAMKEDPSVLNISAGYDYPTLIRWTNGITATTETGEKRFSSKAIPVDLDFLQTLGAKIISGSDFTTADLEEIRANNHSDNFKDFFIVNESAIKELGWNPEQAIGKTIVCGRHGSIKAVVENFHIASFHDPIAPLVIFLSDDFLNLMYVKIDGKNIPASLARLERIWKDRIKDRPFEYDFLDDHYNDLYQLEQQSARFISTFAGLAILLACMGLFGLSAFMAVRRTKEIGIRKVLGASIQDITFMLSRHFLTMVILASMIALPIGWLAARKWLSGFAYHIDMEIWPFIAAGSITLFITLITVSFQSLKASLSNPVDSLRNE